MMKRFRITGYITCLLEAEVYAENEEQAQLEYGWSTDDIGDCIDLNLQEITEV